MYVRYFQWHLELNAFCNGVQASFAAGWMSGGLGGSTGFGMSAHLARAGSHALQPADSSDSGAESTSNTGRFKHMPQTSHPLSDSLQVKVSPSRLPDMVCTFLICEKLMVQHCLYCKSDVSHWLNR